MASWLHVSNTSLDDVTGYINAGGRGTRLSTVFVPDAHTGITKALLRVGSPPLALVEHQVNRLLAVGVKNVVVGAGNHESVARHIVSIYGGKGPVQAIVNVQQLGDGGDLLRTMQEWPQLFSNTVIITNVDTILDWSEAGAFAAHQRNAADLTISVTLAKGVPNEGAFYVNGHDRVVYNGESAVNTIGIDEATRLAVLRGSSTGAIVARANFLRKIRWKPSDGDLSLYRDIMAAALTKSTLYAYNNGKRFFIDVGTAETWRHIQRSPEILEPYLYYTDTSREEMTG